MNKTCYLVLSVKDINRLALAASHHKKAHHAKASTHTVSLYLTVVPDFQVSGADQISWVSFSDSVDCIENEAARREELDKPTPAV